MKRGEAARHEEDCRLGVPWSIARFRRTTLRVETTAAATPHCLTPREVHRRTLLRVPWTTVATQTHPVLRRLPDTSWACPTEPPILHAPAKDHSSPLIRVLPTTCCATGCLLLLEAAASIPLTTEVAWNICRLLPVRYLLRITMCLLEGTLRRPP